MATPSRRCAARAPLISTAFLIALGRMQGSALATNLAPSASSSLAKRIGAVSGSSRTCAFAWPSAASFSADVEGSAISTKSRNSPRTLSPTLAPSMNKVGRPSAGTTAIGERDGSVSDIAAADVEQPGDRVQQVSSTASDFSSLQSRLHLARSSPWRFAPNIRARAATIGAVEALGRSSHKGRSDCWPRRRRA